MNRHFKGFLFDFIAFTLFLANCVVLTAFLYGMSNVN